MPLINPKLPTSKRRDIQVLRAIAVLLVMFYHFDIASISKGYLGVDIFFVISGYLIGTIILRDINNKVFNFKAFYIRRAQRLLPAAYMVLLVTACASSIFLSMPHLFSLLVQLVGSLTFSANILLWLNINYFTGNADLLPLLHIWSLSLEEQFYLVFPLLLFLVKKNYHQALIVGLALASFFLCYFLLDVDASLTFFMLPTRAWELLLGSMLASFTLPACRSALLNNGLTLLALLIIAFVVIIGLDAEHPRFDALLVCLATVLLIYLKASLLNEGWHAKLLAKVGDISYSLYLVHWPLIAIAKNIWIDNSLPHYLNYSLFVISFPLAYGLYRFIEKPFQLNGRFAAIKIRYIVLIGSLLILLPVMATLIMTAHKTHKDWNYIRRVNFGLSANCDFSADFFFKSECSRSAKKAPVLVWGDSYAMHLLPGLINQYKDIGFVQATQSSCAPNLLMAQVTREYNRAWADGCLAFNQSVLQYLKNNAFSYVILASRFNHFEAEVLYGDTVRVVSENELFDSFLKTILAIKALGVTPIIIAPSPVNGAEIGECLEKHNTGGFYISNKLQQDCSYSTTSYIAEQHSIIQLLQRLEKEKVVRVVWPSDVLCNATQCVSSIEGIPLYRDSGHYSIDGSKKLIEKLNILNAYH